MKRIFSRPVPILATCALSLGLTFGFSQTAQAASITIVEIEMDFGNTLMDDVEFNSGLYFLGGSLSAELIYSSSNYLTDPNAVFMDLLFDDLSGEPLIDFDTSVGSYTSDYSEHGSLSFNDNSGAYFGTGLYVQSDTRFFGEPADYFDEFSVGISTDVLDDLFNASAGTTTFYQAGNAFTPGADVVLEEYLYDTTNFDFIRTTAEGNTGDVIISVIQTNTFAMPPAPIPLPAGLPLLLSGVGALVFVRRRRAA